MVSAAQQIPEIGDLIGPFSLAPVRASGPRPVARDAGAVGGAGPHAAHVGVDEPRLVLQHRHGEEHVAPAHGDDLGLRVGGRELRADDGCASQHAARDDEGREGGLTN